MAKVINEIKQKNLIDFLSSNKIKILDLNKLKLLGDGQYKDLKYCRAIEKNSTGRRSYHSNSVGSDGYEEFVRMYVLTKLCNEYGYDPKDIEIEREFKSGSRGSGSDYLDICVYDKNNKNSIFMAIELKSVSAYESSRINSIQNQLYKLAAMASQERPKKTVKYLVYLTVGSINDTFFERCEIIDFEQYPTFDDYESIRNQDNKFFIGSIPKNYGTVNKQQFGNVERENSRFVPLSHVIDRSVSRRLGANLNNLLWGGGAATDNKIFTSLTKLILTKLYDEETTNKNDAYQFQVISKYNPRTKTNEFETNEQLYNRLDQLYKEASINKLYIDARDTHIVDDNLKGKMLQVVNLIQHYNFTKTKEICDEGIDVLGEFFENIIDKGFKQSRGQFFTPTPIARFMVNGLGIGDVINNSFSSNSSILPYIIDPSCGSGTFLIEYMKYVTKFLFTEYFSNLSSLSKAKRELLLSWLGNKGDKNYWAKTYIYGCEINPDLDVAVKVNMVMHGDGASNIFCGDERGDGLLNFDKYRKPDGGESILGFSEIKCHYSHPINGKFDFILSNPPFSGELNSNTIDNVEKNFDLKFKSKNSEHIFVERAYQLLKEKGRMAIILPESVFDGDDSIECRKFLFKYFNVKAIVSLPITTFEPYTSTKVSIVFAQKKTDNEIIEWNIKFKDLLERNANELDAFAVLLKDFDKKTLMVNTEYIGYKKTKTTCLPKPNELFSKQDNENVIFINKSDEKKAIFDITKIEWEE